MLVVVLAVFVVAGLLVGCGSSDGDDAAVPEDQGERVEVSPSLAEVLMDAVLDGELDELDAVTAGMEVVVGDAEPGDVVDVAFEGVDDHVMVRWGVAVEAETGDETLGALLDEVTVSTAQLDAASVGVTSADASGEDGETSLDETSLDEPSLNASGGAGVMLTGSSSEGSVAQGAQSCAEVTGDAGFPLAQCIEGRRYELQGVEVTVWHDADRPIDLGLADKIAAETDVALAWLTEFVNLPERVDVITTGALVGDDGEKIAGFASVGREPTDCVIAIVESAFAKPDRVGVLDHELVHCAQRVTYASQYGPSTVWWYEGSADWAAAQINPEYGQLPYTRWSISTNLTRQSYSAWTFFQFVSQGPANPQAAFDLMASIDAGGGGPSALAAVAGIDSTWVDYAKAWVDGAIPAPDGGTLATSVPPTPYELRTSGDSVDPRVQAFAVEFVYIHVTDVDPDNEIELDIDASTVLGAYFENGWEQIPGGSGTWTLTSPDDPYARNTAVLIGTTQGDQAATANLAGEDNEITWDFQLTYLGHCFREDSDVLEEAYRPVQQLQDQDTSGWSSDALKRRGDEIRAARDRFEERVDECRADREGAVGEDRKIYPDSGACQRIEDWWEKWKVSYEVMVFLRVQLDAGVVPSPAGHLRPVWYTDYKLDAADMPHSLTPRHTRGLGDGNEWLCLVVDDPLSAVPYENDPFGEVVPPFLESGRMSEWRCFHDIEVEEDLPDGSDPGEGPESPAPGPPPAPAPPPAPPPGGLGVVLTSSSEPGPGAVEGENWWCEHGG